MELNAYEFLGVDEGCDGLELRRAYYEMAKLCHPDHGGSADLFIQLKQAFDILSDSRRRQFLGGLRIFRFEAKQTNADENLDIYRKNGRRQHSSAEVRGQRISYAR